MDELDRCCFDHDACFWKLRKNSVSPTTINYDYQYDNNGTIFCPQQEEPHYTTCKCDLNAAICFSGKPYNPNNKFSSIFSRFYMCNKSSKTKILIY